MKNERKTEIKVGVTVLVALFGLVMIIGWAKNFSVNADRKFVKIKFQSVSGLEVGDQVTVNGVRKGYVDNISTKENIVVTTLSLEKDVVLKKDAVFGVEMLDLMGGKKVEIFPGIADELLDVNAIATGDFAADIPSMMKMAGVLSKDFPAVMQDVKLSLNALREYLTDANLKENLRTSLEEVKSITLQVNSFIRNNQKDMSALISGSNQLVKESGAFLNKTSKQIDESVGEIHAVSSKIDNLMTKIDGFLVETKEQKNNLGKVLYDENLLIETKQLLKNLQETMKVLTDQLKGKGINVDLF